MTNVIKATFKITEPMFLGGAEPELGVTQIRPPSVKGALRFWWRALNWSRIRGEAADNAAALRVLHAEECALFGSASGDSGQQAAFLLHVASEVREKHQKDSKIYKDQKGQGYLAGQGLNDRTSGLTRPAIEGAFDVSLRCHPKRVSSAQKEQLRDALIAFGLMGALGARARKGFGSCAIQSLVYQDKECAPQDESSLKAWLREHIPANRQEPPFTALSAHTQIFTAAKTLEQFGEAMTRYRGCKAEKGGDGNFAKDAEDALALLQTRRSNQVPKRAVFGLPLQFQFKQAKGKTVIYHPDGHERRASPLLAHFHEFPTGGRLAVFTLMPAHFLPGTHVTAQLTGSGKVTVETFKPDYEVIRTFLTKQDYLAAKEINYG